MIDPHSGASLKAALKRLVIATVVLYSVLALLIVFVWISAANQRDDLRRSTTQTTTALCTLRNDLQQRVDASKAFLRAHPHGIPGISAKEIQRSIDGQESTIAALAVLDCPPAS